MKNEINLDEKYMDKLKNISFNPVFIIGLQRSGTSILYKILGETGQLNVVTTYHLLKYNELLKNHINKLENKAKNDLNKLFKKKGLTDREIDKIPVTSNYVHEYTYLFSEKDYPRNITLKNKWLFENLCKKIMFISENDNCLLLKNTYEYRHFLFIKSIYPNAKFIFIHRNPIDVISSTMRAWQIVYKNKNKFTALFFKRYNQYYENPLSLLAARINYSSPFPPAVFKVIRNSIKDTKYFLKNIRHLKNDDYISVKFEDLCSEPEEIITNILEFLHIKSNIDFSEFIKPRNLSLTPEVRILKNFIFKKMRPYFEYFEYSI